MEPSNIENATAYLKRKDKKLGRVIDQLGPLNHRRHRGSGFQALVSIIVGQQLSGKAARSIFQRLLAAAGGRTITADNLRPLTDSQLREAGLSNAKVRSIRDLLRHVDDGTLKVRSFHRLSDQEIFDEIVRVKGLGPWSAQMYLMFVLGRPDVFSPGDLGLRKAIAQIYGVDPEKTDFEAFSRRWSPHRTTACRYLWGSLASKPLPSD